MKKVIIVGAGFAGLSAAKLLGNKKDIDVLVLDKRNHHLFQPLLYQVAMAGLSPAEISAPIRSILSGYANISVLQE
ncbi:MAG: FAD-dependent oxidoreductase, partial [Calditrichaeota bacterium]|nr:FAD-dependent oxidoreductase [Calditrichota bacterium]